jgi:serine/threonine protein kinase
MNKYKIKKFIKSGSYGSVYEVEDPLCNKVALKISFYDHILSGFGNLKELDILSRLSNFPIVPRLIDVIMTYSIKPRDNSKMQESLSFVTELADTDLESFIRNRKYTPEISIVLSAQILLAIDFLHSMEITHRDIKPGNILIKFTSEGPQIKICDFGFAHFLCNGAISTPMVATAWYRAPEICWEIEHYRYTSDIWSVGMTIYEIFTGNILLYNVPDTNGAIFNAILSRIPVKIDSELLRFYRSQCRINIHIDSVNDSRSKKYIPATPLINQFEKCRNYHLMSPENWRHLESLLLEMFNLNYRKRKSANECLLSPLFNSQRDMIKNYQSILNHPRCLDPIFILENNRIYNEKNEAFIRFMESSKRNQIGMRVLFHSVDLANQYFNKYPNCTEVTKVVHGTLYFYNKYFSTMKYPEPPEYFFSSGLENEILFLENLDLWIFNFEKDILTNIVNKYCIYRPGLYEMPDEYSHLLERNQKEMLFREFVGLRSWNGTSYRDMYRKFYVKLINPRAEFRLK